jgi:GT2 family glycosyltransferase
MEKIAVIILHWKNFEDTAESLRSVAAIEGAHFETILVDNGSEDGARLKREFPEVHHVENERNLGFAEGNNRGIIYALERGATFIFLLNNDTVVQKDILTVLTTAAHRHPEAGVFGAKIYYYEEPTTIWYAGGGVDPLRMRCYHHGYLESDLDKKWEEERETEYACGCALFIRADGIREVGLLDPNFFLIWEEIDWCWRLRKAGFRSLFVPQAKVWHKISASFEGGNRGPMWHYFYSKNRLLFLKKHYSKEQRLSFYKNYLLKEIWYLVLQLKEVRARAALKGVFHYFFA